MTCLITGDRGFIGRHLKEYLLSRKEDVIGFDILRDYPTTDVLTKFMKYNSIDKIYHLGARPFIPDCYGNNIEVVVNSNVTFTANLLSACRKADIKKLLYFSTSEVYGNPKYLPIDEKHPTNPQSTYAATKFAAENLCRTFSKETGLDVVVMRQFNVYGPRDTWPRIIPKIMQSAKTGQALFLGNIDAMRDFTFVYDSCRAAHNIMEAETSHYQIINHGYGRGYTIREIIEVVEKIYNKKMNNVVFNTDGLKRPWDVEKLVCDNKLYESIFGKTEQIPLYDGIKYTKEWYDKNDWPWENTKA